MLTYVTQRDEVLDLSNLPEDQRACFDGAYADFRAGAPAREFEDRYVFRGNPLVAAAGGMVTRPVWDHPLFKALQAMAFRLGVDQRVYAATDETYPSDPVADEWVPVSEAAALKDVAVTGLHAAIRRGDLVAHPTKPGGSRLVVRRNSLERWQPSPTRQRAARAWRADRALAPA